jgi:hypothetical protein
MAEVKAESSSGERQRFWSRSGSTVGVTVAVEVGEGSGVLVAVGSGVSVGFAVFVREGRAVACSVAAVVAPEFTSATVVAAGSPFEQPTSIMSRLKIKRMSFVVRTNTILCS